MRVILAAGDMGKRTVRALFSGIDQVIVAGRSRERFEAFLREINMEKTKLLLC